MYIYMNSIIQGWSKPIVCLPGILTPFDLKKLHHHWMHNDLEVTIVCGHVVLKRVFKQIIIIIIATTTIVIIIITTTTTTAPVFT